MKQAAWSLCCIAALALPCVTLGAVVSKADHQLSRTGDLTATAHETSRGLRGVLQASNAPHVSKLTELNLGKKEGVKAKKHSHSWLQSFKTRLHRIRTHRRAMQKQNQTQKLGLCHGSKLRWWIKIKKKCNKAFGSKSRWDRDKQEGKCAEAWNECNTGFYAVCCTQPLGPKNMDAYCAKQNLTFVTVNASDANANQSQDKACTVQNKMMAVKDAMNGIKNTIGLMDQDGPAFGPGPGPAPMPVPAPAPALPPSGLMPMGAPAPAMMVLGPALAGPLETRCSMLTELTRQAAERIKDIKTWAETGGFDKKSHYRRDHKTEDDKLHKDKKEDRQSLRNHHEESLLQEKADDAKDEEKMQSAEAADPDLFFSVRGVLQVGKKLNHILKNSNFCNQGPDEDDDDDDDEAEDDLAKDPTENWDDDDDDDYEEPVMKINDTAILDLLNFEGDMTNAVNKFEKEVHPHGFKWWRYRYEYTIVESMVLAFSVLVLYLTMWIMHGVSFFGKYKFYKTGVTARLERYAWGYFVFHAAALMVMVTTAYMLYIPWGKQNIFNICAEAFHDFVDGRFNVPFLGYSWLYMVLDVQFQLFVCFAIYSIFIVMIASHYKKALEDFKALADEREDVAIDPSNRKTYAALQGIMQKRVQNKPGFIKIFTDLRLRLKGVEGLDKTGDGWNDFKLHLYLTDGLGKSLEYLVMVSLTTNIFLAISALVVAVLAHHYQVAFMYFLPMFLVLGVVMFALSYFVSWHFRKLSEGDDHKSPYHKVTVHSYCRAIQIMLYCLFFSFSRLLLSNDIFTFYPMVYLAALVGLVASLVLLWVFATRIIKETVCSLILPPHLEKEQFKNNLEQVVFWYTQEYCHETGAQQFPSYACLSREWARATPAGDPKEIYSGPDSDRPNSFR